MQIKVNKEKIVQLYRTYVEDLQPLDDAMLRMAECHLGNLHENDDDIEDVEVVNRTDRDRAGSVRIMIRALAKAVNAGNEEMMTTALNGLYIALTYLGSPGDWGHHTRTGRAISRAMAARIDLNKALAEYPTWPRNDRNGDLNANIEGNELVIRIGIDALAKYLEYKMVATILNDKDELLTGRVKILDADQMTTDLTIEMMSVYVGPANPENVHDDPCPIEEMLMRCADNCGSHAIQIIDIKPDAVFGPEAK